MSANWLILLNLVRVRRIVFGDVGLLDGRCLLDKLTR